MHQWVSEDKSPLLHLNIAANLYLLGKSYYAILYGFMKDTLKKNQWRRTVLTEGNLDFACKLLLYYYANMLMFCKCNWAYQYANVC